MTSCWVLAQALNNAYVEWSNTMGPTVDILWSERKFYIVSSGCYRDPSAYIYKFGVLSSFYSKESWCFLRLRSPVRSHFPKSKLECTVNTQCKWKKKQEAYSNAAIMVHLRLSASGNARERGP